MKYELADAMDETFVPATSAGRANQWERITASQAEQYITLLRTEVRRLRAGLETIRDTFNSDTASVVNGTIRVHVHTHVERVLE